MKRSAEKIPLGLFSKPEELEAFRRSLLDWFSQHGRHEIPWKLMKNQFKKLKQWLPKAKINLNVRINFHTAK